MESVLGRYRNLIILVGVLFLQVLGLAMQVKRGTNAGSDTRLIRVWAVGAITPFERGIVWAQESGRNLWHNYFYLRGVRAENRELKAEIEQMRLEQVRMSEDAAQARRLQALLAFKEQYIQKTIAAQVIGSSGSDLSRVVFIDKGENDGLKRDMAVMTADGIVGKVLTVYPSVAQVLLISDQSSGVGAILEQSRLQGVLRGTPNGEVMLERVMSDEQVPVGEKVLTSGGDQIFPKGLPIGTIAKVGNGKDLFLNIKVKPAADLSRLEEVLVLVEKQDRQVVADDSSHSRTADILAARLPSVPDKPADANPTPANSSTEGAAPVPSKSPSAAKPPVLSKGAIGGPGTHGVATETAKVVNPAASASKPIPNSAAVPLASASGAASKPATAASKETPASGKPVTANGSAAPPAHPAQTTSSAQSAGPKLSAAPLPTAKVGAPKSSAPKTASSTTSAPNPSADDANPH